VNTKSVCKAHYHGNKEQGRGANRQIYTSPSKLGVISYVQAHASC